MLTDGYYCGDHIMMYINAESLGYTPETNIILYANFTLIKNLKNKKYRQ